MARRLGFVVGTALLALAACAGDPEPRPAPPDTTAATDSARVVDPLAEPARRAMQVELRLDAYRRVEGAWTAGDATSTFTAYFDGDSLRLITEDVSLGEYGDGANTYYFAEGALFYAVEDEERVRLDPAASGQRDTVRLRVAFDRSGRATASEQTVNGEPVPVQPTDTDGARNHARALWEQARRAARPML